MARQTKAYRVKEAFYTLQGEGANQGRPAVFCRFSKCNLWTGREADRATAVCNFCDTDFVGVDGQNGGIFASAEALAAHLLALWPTAWSPAFVVCTGGEPLLQLDAPLIEALHAADFEIAIETNGTLPAPAGIDWICLSPKSTAPVVLSRCDELKLVFPQDDLLPEDCAHIQAQHYFLSPRDDSYLASHADNAIPATDHTASCVAYCMANPQWKLSLQTHKYLGID